MAGGTNYRPFAPEIWSSYVKVYFQNKMFASKHFMNFSSDLKGGGDMITIPHLTKGPAVGSFTTTTGAITDFIVVETRTQLTINNWKYSSKKFSDFEWGRIANNYNLQNMYLQNDIAYRLADKFEVDLLNQQLSTIYPHTGTSAVQISNTAIQEAIRITATYSVEADGLAWFLHPNAFYGELLRKNQFYDASQFGRPVQSAGLYQPIGNLYGMPLYITNNIPTGSGIGGDGYPSTSHVNLLVHKRTIVYAIGNIDGMGIGPRLKTMPVADAAAFRVIGDLAYGIKTTDNYGGVRMVSDT